MCGYCTESFALRVMQLDQEILALSRDKPMFATVAFQELLDLPSGLLEISDTCINSPSVALSILCRAIELLVTKGFDSEGYQRLICIPAFTAAIRAACANPSPPDTSASTDLRERFPVDDYRWLYAEETYFEAHQFQNQSNQLAPSQSDAVLLRYFSWWLEGDYVAGDTHQLRQIYPMVWFSLLWSAKTGEIDQTAWSIVMKAKNIEPDFDALDLWLQRRAVISVYQQDGIAPFILEIERLRPELIAYLILGVRLSQPERQLLSDRIRQLPGEDLTGETSQFSVRELLVKFPTPLSS